MWKKNAFPLVIGMPRSGLSFIKMWKKNSVRLVSFFLLLVFLQAAFRGAVRVHGASFAGTAPPPPVAVYLNGRLLNFDVPPLLKEGSLMLPLRRLFEEMGYRVTWEAEARRAVLNGFGRIVVLYPHNPLYTVNGVVYRTANLPFIERGRLMVGLDFLRESAVLEKLVWEAAEGKLYLEYRRGPGSHGELPPEAQQYRRAGFVEVLLPPGNRIQVGETFEVVLAAPFVRDVFSFEVSFFYNPEVIKVKDVKNYTYNPAEEFYLKRINNQEGMIKYTQTYLGYRENIPPRSHLVVIEAVPFREGAVPFMEGNLKVVLFNNRAAEIPVALENKTLYIGR